MSTLTGLLFGKALVAIIHSDWPSKTYPKNLYNISHPVDSASYLEYLVY